MHISEFNKANHHQNMPENMGNFILKYTIEQTAQHESRKKQIA